MSFYQQPATSNQQLFALSAARQAKKQEIGNQDTITFPIYPDWVAPVNANAHAVRMHLIETSSRCCILEELEYAISPWRRFAGLMGRRSLPGGHGLYFPRCSSIHTCFMRFTIDIIYVDAGWKVMKTVQYMKPWRLSYCHGASGVIETAAGCIAEKDIATGIELQPVDNGEIRE